MSFAGFLRQSTAIDVLIGPFLDSTDGDTEETGLTISQADVLLSKNGQALAQKNDATAAAHDAGGFYNCELDATDTNTVGQLVLKVHESGALVVRHDFQVLEENVYDAWWAASAAAGTDLASILTDTGEIGTAGAGLSDLGGMSTGMKGEVNAEVDTAFTTQMADSVPADGTIPTREQAILMITRFLWEKAVSGTTVTVFEEDGSTSNMTFTLDDGTNPTSITRAT